MKKLLIVFTILALLCGGSSYWAEAKEIPLNATSKLTIPEACPDYREFKPLPAALIAVNKETHMAIVAQEGQRGEEFVLVVFVAQFNTESNTEDIFILFIMHSDMKEPGKPATRIFADKAWIDKGTPSGVLVEVSDLPKEIDFYKAQVNKRFLRGRMI